jgi:hypothetical protein
VTVVPTTPARRRPTTWLALALLALALGMIAFMFASAVLPGHAELSSSLDDVGDLLTIVPSLAAYLALPAVGAVLAILRPRNPVGWILLVGGVTLILGDFEFAYVERSIEVEPLPGYTLVDWFAPALTTLGIPLLAIWLPLLFPDGHLPGRRWRPVAWLASLAIALTIAVMFVIDIEDEFGRQLPNPTALGGDAGTFGELLYGVAQAMIVGSLALAILSVAVRFRRSQDVERQQLKWFVAAASLVFVSIIGMAVLFVLGSELASALYVLVMTALGFLPIAIGIAVLRYRLYDIDRLISRTIGWALVTGILVAVFAGAVIGLQALLAGVTQGETLAVAASTLAAFALFQPLRRRIQAAVDRRFDRARYDGQQLVSAFGERLRDEVELEAIRAEIPATVDAAVRPAHVGVWLRSGGEGTAKHATTGPMHQGAV